MTNIIKTYIDKHYNPKLDPLMVKRLSYQQSRKFQPFYQYLQLTKSQLFRQKDSPTGLRNIGNTCYLNIFLQLLYHVNDIRDMFIDSHFNKERLLMAIQGLFGKMVFSKYSFCDTEQVFEELNRGSGNKVSLGVQYDFHEYLSIQLDNIEKVLRSEGLEQKSGVLDKVFCGKYRQSVRAGEEVSVSESKFGMITLDGKIGDLRAAYDAFRNYKVEGYKTKKGLETGQVKIEIQKFPPLLSFFINRVTIDKGNLVKHNGEFTYPNYLQLDKTTNDFVYNLSEQDELLERKIQTIEDIIEKKQYKVILESLSTTKKFLDEQSYETVTNASLDVEGIDNHFGIIGSEQTHEQTKSSISQYIKKLSNQQANLLHTLSTLKQQKRKSLETKKLQKYSLFALMIHAGSATSGHYYIFIYNESQKKWRKYSDRTVQQVPESLVHSIAQGKADKETNVCCIIYKHPEFKCNPFEKPPIPASLKSKINEADFELGKIIDNLKVERMVRTCASLAEEEALFYQEEFAKKKGDMFVDYFSEIVNYFISVGNMKMAELSRLKALLSEPSFRYEVGNLIGEKELTLPDIPLVVSKDYFNSLTIIRKALYFESVNNIPSAIALLSFHTPSQPATLSYYNELILVFLFKACFYLDLYQQLSKDVRVLLQVMNYALGLFKKNVYTDQLSANIRYSVPNAAEYLKEKVDLRKVAEMPAVDNVQMSIKGQLEGRLGVWKRMYVEIKETGKVLTQEQRNDIEMPLLIEEAKSIK